MDAPWRRPLVRTTARMLLTAACALTLYAVAPLDVRFGPASALALLGALAALGVLVGWQARSIVSSPSPWLRALEALVTSLVLFLVVFASAYRLMDSGGPGHFSERLSKVDAFYFTVTMFSSVGFGDIVPLSTAARILATVQMLGDLVFLGAVGRVLLEAARRGAQRAGRGGLPRRPR
ncbi:two pore domain potassium channel family protein [Actinomadura sp. LD22]|uniref:Two pore domain potassium channel family protein n=1 Tax=Actinomadura physcomitrii TaxID=2650748 RepID=A0A6I4MHH3_9ACTN|nr:potassium channel family protein [Actinomadura physcomitrii]MWA05628.1 two pore domain potassium channel family protein [Actinomadura physcomitrii]